MQITQTDIVIVGAGPAGAATALKLSYAGVSCTLLDRADFPRDKVCGDALSGKVPVLLDRLDPAIMNRFRARYQPTDAWGIRFLPPNQRTLDFPFVHGYVRNPAAAPGYVCKRLDFDNFLVEEVRRRSDVDLHLGTEITAYERSDRGFRITAAGAGLAWDARLLIDASGAHSKFSRQFGGLEIDRDHHAAAVRAYFSGVRGCHPDNFIELHFLEEYNPGYFWIFPLPNGQANVGLGMRSDEVGKRKVNLRRELDAIVASPAFADRFRDAVQTAPTVGYGLPLGSKDRTLSGDHYLLTGDAGHLIDPLTGEGIGNGMYSGYLAADQAVEALRAQRYDAAFLAGYDRAIERVLRSELRLSYRMQQLMTKKWLTNLITAFVSNNPRIIELLSRMYTDFEFRKQLVRPGFWWKLFRSKPEKLPAATEN